MLALGLDYLGEMMTSSQLSHKLINAAANAVLLFSDEPEIASLENNLGYSFADKSLLLQALTHKSFGHEKSLPNNEVLEFLGDAVLDLVITDKLIELYPDKEEGELSKLRSAIVNKTTLATVAMQVGVSEAILLGKGELASGGQMRESNLSNALEALFGAIFKESDIETATHCILGVFGKARQDYFDFKLLEQVDIKGQLQELVYKKYGSMPKYNCIEVKKEKQMSFQIYLEINGKTVAEGMYSSKKKGMQELAGRALKELQQGEI